MQTQLADFIRNTPAGKEADAELRKCVHCGFCLATCPTYQVLGDELDSPRGRIYLIKQVLEGKVPTETTRLHLDRCLTCRACETTCPSGVEYHKLLDVGRDAVAQQVPRTAPERWLRRILGAVFASRWLFQMLAWKGRAVSFLLPAPLRRQLQSVKRKPLPRPLRERRMVLLSGCVQPGLRPNINDAARRVLDRAGISLVEAPTAGCCGALRFHLGETRAAMGDMRAVVDAWWPYVENRLFEAIVVTASGCSAHLKDLGRLMAHDPAYAKKAEKVAAMVRDLAEVAVAESLALIRQLDAPESPTRVAFQSPCTLQHGQGIRGSVELLLKAAGYELVPVADAHLCCGSAGTYSIFQPQLARELRGRKLAALEAGAPTAIATANIGCLTHLAAGTQTPVRHWIELLDERLKVV